MEKVRENYETGMKYIGQKLDQYIREFDTIISSSTLASSEVEVLAQHEKILNLQDDLTALLVPPEYRKKHLNQVLLFREIKSIPDSENRLLEHYKLILANIGGI